MKEKFDAETRGMGDTETVCHVLSASPRLRIPVSNL